MHITSQKISRHFAQIENVELAPVAQEALDILPVEEEQPAG